MKWLHFPCGRVGSRMFIHSVQSFLRLQSLLARHHTKMKSVCLLPAFFSNLSLSLLATGLSVCSRAEKLSLAERYCQGAPTVPLFPEGAGHLSILAS